MIRVHGSHICVSDPRPGDRRTCAVQLAFGVPPQDAPWHGSVRVVTPRAGTLPCHHESTTAVVLGTGTVPSTGLAGHRIFANDLSAFNLIAWVPGIMAVIIPRGLMLILIFQDRGMSAWLLVHAIAMAVVYAGAGSGSRGL